jgi:LysM repeat protein
MVDPHNDNHEDFVIHPDDDGENGHDFSREDHYDRGEDIFQKKSMLPYVIGGMAILVLAVVLTVILAGPRNGANTAQLLAMEAKIRQLEKRLSTIGVIDQALTRLDKQQENFNTLTQRLDQFEATVNTQLDQVIKELGVLHQKTDHPATLAKPAAKKAGASAKTVSVKNPAQYHQVQTGETLYRIARRYGLTVKQLQRYNNIGPGASIYPGQKLRLAAPAKP